MTAVEIVEVAPRDGLQAEPRIVPTADKVALVEALAACGFRRIEVASFVRPDRVPQMADGAAVLAAVPPRAGLARVALVPNLRGYAAARAAGADAVAVFAAASEGFAQANTGGTVAEVLARCTQVLAQARADGVAARAYVSCVTDCPHDGPVPPTAVARVAAALWQAGATEVALGETLGRATAPAVAAMLAAVLDEVPAAALAGHFHDTGGRALAHVAAALDRGLRVFDGSAGGLGGCPFAPGAAGNLSSERLAAFLQAQGCTTGLDMAALAAAAGLARRLRDG